MGNDLTSMVYNETAEELPPSSFGTRFKFEMFFVAILAIITLIQFFYRDQFFTLVEPIVDELVLLIAGSMGASMPGIVYRGGEWYRKVVKGEFVTSRERAFFVFLLEVILAIVITLSLQRLFLAVMPQIKAYFWLVLLEWFLVIYIWFTRMKKFTFPWFYFIATNGMIAIFAFLTYKFV